MCQSYRTQTFPKFHTSNILKHCLIRVFKLSIRLEKLSWRHLLIIHIRLKNCSVYIQTGYYLFVFIPRQKSLQSSPHIMEPHCHVAFVCYIRAFMLSELSMVKPEGVVAYTHTHKKRKANDMGMHIEPWGYHRTIKVTQHCQMIVACGYSPRGCFREAKH